ncbi:MAG: hypothetical protein IKG15_11705 [Solobacterium sp.]|nr:hypothetical protein [Solobacterium sp.]
MKNKKSIIWAIIVVCLLIALNWMLSLFPEMPITENDQLELTILPSPPETATIQDKEQIEQLLTALYTADKEFAGFSFESGWIMHIRYRNRSYMFVDSYVRSGSRIWKIDQSSYETLLKMGKQLCKDF